MKVIVAGYGKTGTKSMQVALGQLGYVVYDFIENYKYLHDDWTKIILEGEDTLEDFRRMFENVDAVTDIPGCFFWDEIHKAFPDSKIILTTRESEDAWAKSFANQWSKDRKKQFLWYVAYCSPTMRKIGNFASLALNTSMGTQGTFTLLGPSSFNMTLARMAYRKHNSHVLQTAPKDKLLVYSVKEGWEPLCKFLEVDVPEVPFPHKNVRGNIVEKILAKDPVIIRGKIEIYVSLTLSSIVLCYGLYRFAKSSPSVWMTEAWNWSKTFIFSQY